MTTTNDKPIDPLPQSPNKTPSVLPVDRPVSTQGSQVPDSPLTTPEQPQNQPTGPGFSSTAPQDSFSPSPSQTDSQVSSQTPPLQPPVGPAGEVAASDPVTPLQSPPDLGEVSSSPHPSSASVATQPESANTKTESPPKPKGKYGKILAIILAVVFLGVLGFIGYQYFRGNVENKKIDLVWWGLWEDEAVVSSLIEEYQADNPNVTVTYVNQSKEDYRERLTNSLAKGEGPDIFRIHNTWVPMFRGELSSMPDSVMTTAEYSDTFFPTASADMLTATGVVGIPLEYDGLVMYVNEDLLAGRTIPTNWDDFRKTALELTTIDEDGDILQSGTAMGRTENVDHWPEILGLLMLQNGADLGNPSGKLAEDALSYFVLFSNASRVWDETLPRSTVAFASGKAAMYFGPSWRAFEIDTLNPELNYKTVPVPQLPKGPGASDITYATYWSEAVWGRSENQEAAWNFLAFMATKDSQEKLFANASATRSFGAPYSRIDMVDLLGDHPVLGALLSQAQSAKSWYLADRTFDGVTGINSLVKSYFEEAVNSVNNGASPESALLTTAQGVAQVLAQYGLQ